jgi:hypothetical protein
MVGEHDIGLKRFRRWDSNVRGIVWQGYRLLGVSFFREKLFP